MEIIILAIVLVFVICFIGIFFSIIWFNRQTNARIDALNSHIVETKDSQRQSTETFGQIQKSIGELSKTSSHMEAVGKEISSLNDILRAPKLRGGIGELLLGDLLSQILSPENFKLQYTFKSGERVDAVIILKPGMVPVDAKFPLDSFRRMVEALEGDEQSKHKKDFKRAVKGHIDSIAKKYIVPDEGTFEFALMYIPAENVYYETIIKDEGLGEDKSLINYAIEQHVIPVSPNCFYAYLQAIALGLKGLQIEKQAKEIMNYLSRIESDFDRFKMEYNTLGEHIERSRKKYEASNMALGRFEEKFKSTHGPSRVPPPSEINMLPTSVGDEKE